MTDIRDAEAQPPDDSGGYCCVSAGMHMGHDEDCQNCPPWLLLGALRWSDEQRRAFAALASLREEKT